MAMVKTKLLLLMLLLTMKMLMMATWERFHPICVWHLEALRSFPSLRPIPTSRPIPLPRLIPLSRPLPSSLESRGSSSSTNPGPIYPPKSSSKALRFLEYKCCFLLNVLFLCLGFCSLDQGFPTCGTRTTSGTWTVGRWYAETFFEAFA